MLNVLVGVRQDLQPGNNLGLNISVLYSDRSGIGKYGNKNLDTSGEVRRRAESRFHLPIMPNYQAIIMPEQTPPLPQTFGQ